KVRKNVWEGRWRERPLSKDGSVYLLSRAQHRSRKTNHQSSQHHCLSTHGKDAKLEDEEEKIGTDVVEGGRWEVSDQEIVCLWPRTEVGGVAAAGAVVPTSAVAAGVRSAR
ncbi:unnamed protein product, partial [Musa acuminata subsp. burmannicoides]